MTIRHAFKSIAFSSKECRFVLRRCGKLCRLLLLLAICISTFRCPPASAISFSWNNGSGGLWGTADNWNPAGGPPDVGDTASLNLFSTYTVQLTGGTAHEADGVAIRNGVVTLESDSTSLPGAITVTSGSADFEVLSGSATIGSTGRPVTLTVGDNFTTANIASTTVTANSDVTAADLILGTAATSDALLRVTGAGSTVTITGATAAIAGFGGKAALIIENGATATLSGPIATQIGVSPNVDNTRGTVEVLTGGILNTRSIQVGFGAGGKLAKLLVKDSNSTVNQTGTSGLVVGNSSNNEIVADITVADSAVFNSGTGSINFVNTGTLHVVESGTFNANGPLRFNRGAATIDGGTLNSNGPLTIDNGTVSLVAGVVDAGTINLVNGGTLNFNGGTLHVNSFNGNLTNLGGKLAPGHSVGSTTITGNYTQQPSGKLEIEIGGTSPGSAHDVVSISSIAGLNGELQLALLDGFLPSGSDTFTVLTAAGGVVGTFSNIANGQRLTTLDSLGSFLVHYGTGSAFNSNQLVLSAFEPAVLPGDHNHDGTVDAADFVAWRKSPNNFGGVPGGYSTWRTHFGQTTSGEATMGAAMNSTVPEPGGLALLTLAVPVLLRRRKYQRI